MWKQIVIPVLGKIPFSDKMVSSVSAYSQRVSNFFYFPRTIYYSTFTFRFVIELCEPIQVKQLDIANFELFSSTPKDFLVSISDRYAKII